MTYDVNCCVVVAVVCGRVAMIMEMQVRAEKVTFAGGEERFLFVNASFLLCFLLPHVKLQK